MNSANHTMQRRVRGGLFEVLFQLRFKIPSYLTLLSLWVLTFSFLARQELESAITLILLVVGISVAISQTCFTYEPLLKQAIAKRIARKAGEELLAASIRMSISALIFYLFLGPLRVVFENYWFLKLLKILLVSAAGLDYIYSTIWLNKGINRLGYYLFMKLDFPF